MTDFWDRRAVEKGCVDCQLFICFARNPVYSRFNTKDSFWISLCHSVLNPLCYNIINTLPFVAVSPDFRGSGRGKQTSTRQPRGGAHRSLPSRLLGRQAPALPRSAFAGNTHTNTQTPTQHCPLSLSHRQKNTHKNALFIRQLVANTRHPLISSPCRIIIFVSNASWENKKLTLNIPT